MTEPTDPLIYFGPPSLPEGESHTPDPSLFTPVTQHDQTATIQLPIMEIALEGQLEQFSQEDQDVIKAWYPQCYHRPSNHIGGIIVVSAAQVLAHAKGEGNAQSKKEASNRSNAAKSAAAQAAKEQRNANRAPLRDAWLNWQNECTLRKQWIEQRKVAVELAKQQRAEAIAPALQLIAEWDAYVARIEQEYRTAKATPAPARPTV